MTEPAYFNAPITEAVIEIKFKESIDLAELDKVSGRYVSDYPQHQQVQTLSVNLELSQKQPEAKFDTVVGHRRSSVDMTELLLFFRSAFLMSQLAPYPGWEAFFARFGRDWAVWKRVLGFREITRVGVRYINRIDIPISGPTVEFEEFLNIYPKLPEIFAPVNAYAVQAVLPLDEIGCKLTLNSGAIPSPILDYSSFLFDQDIAREIDPPQSDQDIFSLLTAIRVQKNKIFESCITDRARKLFSR